MEGVGGEAVMVQGPGAFSDTVAPFGRVIVVVDGKVTVDPAGILTSAFGARATVVPSDFVRVAATGGVMVALAGNVTTEPAETETGPSEVTVVVTGAAAEVPDPLVAVLDPGQAKENPLAIEKLAPTPRSPFAWKTVNMMVFTISQAERITTRPIREAKIPFFAVSMVLWLPEETMYKTPIAVMTARAMNTMMFRMYSMREAMPETM
jgi:hypothetical protein